MRFLRLEMKRVLTTKMTWVLLAAALLFSVLMAYIPVTFEAVSYTDEQGRKVELEGRDAVVYLKTLRKNVEGEVTPEKVKTALAAYQKCLGKYGVTDTYELPDGADTESLMPYWDYMYRIRETFADSETGIAPALMEIDLDDVDHFYEKADLRLESLMKMEQPERMIFCVVPNMAEEGWRFAKYCLRCSSAEEHFYSVCQCGLGLQILYLDGKARRHPCSLCFPSLICRILILVKRNGYVRLLHLSCFLLCLALHCLYLPKRRVRYRRWQHRWGFVYCRY